MTQFLTNKWSGKGGGMEGAIVGDLTEFKKCNVWSLFEFCSNEPTTQRNFVKIIGEN